MNDSRRKELAQSYELLSKTWGLIATVLQEEQDALDRHPVTFKNGSKYKQAEELVEQLIAALNHIDGAVTCINDVIEK